ncbi:MAG TPA: hypothetical protein VFJ95_13975 [Gammaproteobacteria bacterium]|nr:hypothetical protein [Gammaproteobacteria bacterium]
MLKRVLFKNDTAGENWSFYGLALGVARDAVAVVADRKIVLAVLAATRDCNGARVRLDAVLHELGDCL